MTETVTIALIGLAGGSATGAVVAGLFSLVNRVIDRRGGMNAGMRFLLHGEIERRCLRYIRRGSITPDELEMLLESHHVYHDKLGGNGYLDDLMRRCKALPIK